MHLTVVFIFVRGMFWIGNVVVPMITPLTLIDEDAIDEPEVIEDTCCQLALDVQSSVSQQMNLLIPELQGHPCSSLL